MKSILEQKNINTLCHFTRAENLQSIFEYGIMSRTTLAAEGIQYYYNDMGRYDRCYNAVCTSIEFPNYKMFYSLRMSSADVDWVVLKLDSRVLCDFECAYCWTNAADRSIAYRPIEERMGMSAFLELFEDRKGYPMRSELGIPESYPTNPQAEVLIFNTIPPSYIIAACFENRTDTNNYWNDIAPDMIRIDERLFRPRRDWNEW